MLKIKTKLNRRLNQNGFGHFEMFLVVLVIFAVVAVGFYVLKYRNDGINSSKADNVEQVVSLSAVPSNALNSSAAKTISQTLGKAVAQENANVDGDGNSVSQPHDCSGGG